jgi:hypothetical protein
MPLSQFGHRYLPVMHLSYAKVVSRLGAPRAENGFHLLSSAAHSPQLPCEYYPRLSAFICGLNRFFTHAHKSGSPRH